jgi:hypothetical protein
MRSALVVVVALVTVVGVFGTGGALAHSGTMCGCACPHFPCGGGGGYFAPPYSQGFVDSGAGCDKYALCGQNTVYADSVNASNGQVSVAVQSDANVAEGATQYAEAWFAQNVGHPTGTGDFTFTFPWKVNWFAQVGNLCAPGYGDGQGTVLITVSANIYDDTSHSWLLNTNATSTIMSTTVYCPLFAWVDAGSPGVNPSFTGYLTTADTYTAYTWVHVETSAVAVALDSTQAQAFVSFSQSGLGAPAGSASEYISW